MKNGAFAARVSFTRPADTTPYTSGDLVANSTTAGSVTPLEFSGLVGVNGFPVGITRARIVKSATSLTNAQFRLHLFSSTPTVSVGDNAAFNSSEALAVDTVASYLGTIDITVGKSGTAASVGIGVPTTGELAIDFPTSGSLFGLLEARAAYTPGNAETFTVVLEGLR